MLHRKLALALLHRHDFQDGAPWDEALSANLIALHYGLDEDELRILIRPSGTEPKVKTYFEYRSAQETLSCSGGADFC